MGPDLVQGALAGHGPICLKSMFFLFFLFFLLFFWFSGGVALVFLFFLIFGMVLACCSVMGSSHQPEIKLWCRVSEKVSASAFIFLSHSTAIVRVSSPLLLH